MSFRHTIRAMTKFQKYIKNNKHADTASLLGVSLRCINAYSIGYRNPKMIDLPRLVERSNGALKISDFWEQAE